VLAKGGDETRWTDESDNPSNGDDSSPNSPALDSMSPSMLRVLGEDLEEDGSRGDEGV